MNTTTRFKKKFEIHISKRGSKSGFRIPNTSILSLRQQYHDQLRYGTLHKIPANQ